jgi:hypothetical protein
MSLRYTQLPSEALSRVFLGRIIATPVVSHPVEHQPMGGINPQYFLFYNMWHLNTP